MSTHRAKKGLGQHFLVNEQTIQMLQAAIDSRNSQHIVEIGPGKGALTRALVHRCAQLDLIEFDRDLIPLLISQFGNVEGVTIHHENALQFDFKQCQSDADDTLRIVGNLPYNISTPLLFHVLGYIHLVQDFHFMLQREVVHRICAKTGDRNYNRLSIAIQNVCEPICLFDIPPAHFSPPPKVYSSFLRMVPRAHALVPERDQPVFHTITNAAFSQARKTLRNSLKSLFTAKQLEMAGIDPNIRPQHVSIQQFATLARSGFANDTADK